MNDNTEQNEDKKGAAVKFPPPLVFALFILAAYGLHYLNPIMISTTMDLFPYAVAVLSVGAAIILISFFTFRFAKTTIEPWKPTANIIQTGIFAYSRNPIYVAFGILTLAIALYFNSLWIALSIIPATFTIFHIAIKKEEAYLALKFGDEYLSYKAKVRRWL